MASQNVEIVREFTALFEAGDRDSWHRYFATDVVWDVSQTDLPMAGVYEGHDGIERFFRDWLSAWDDLRLSHNEYIDAGDSVVVVFRQAARGRGSGAMAEREFFGVYDMRDGLVARYHQYESRAEALSAAGRPA
jgi:ketosteroid isomerase-like protein